MYTHAKPLNPWDWGFTFSPKGGSIANGGFAFSVLGPCGVLGGKCFFRHPAGNRFRCGQRFPWIMLQCLRVFGKGNRMRSVSRWQIYMQYEWDSHKVCVNPGVQHGFAHLRGNGGNGIFAAAGNETGSLLDRAHRIMKYVFMIY